MSRQYKNGKCSCWAKLDKKLEEADCAVDYGFDFSGKTYMAIRTFRTKGRKPPVSVFAAYCPFCGEKLK